MQHHEDTLFPLGSSFDVEGDPLFDPRFEQLSAYLDGELSSQEARLVEEWLAQDPSARVLYRNLSTVQAALQRLPLSPKERSVKLICSAKSGLCCSPRPLQRLAAFLVICLGVGLTGWQPQPLLSIDDPPVSIARILPSARIAQRYLLHSPTSQDPYTILFTETLPQ
jgi:hypothetical protein